MINNGYIKIILNYIKTQYYNTYDKTFVTYHYTFRFLFKEYFIKTCGLFSLYYLGKNLIFYSFKDDLNKINEYNYNRYLHKFKVFDLLKTNYNELEEANTTNIIKNNKIDELCEYVNDLIINLNGDIFKNTNNNSIEYGLIKEIKEYYATNNKPKTVISNFDYSNSIINSDQDKNISISTLYSNEIDDKSNSFYKLNSIKNLLLFNKDDINNIIIQSLKDDNNKDNLDIDSFNLIFYLIYKHYEFINKKSLIDKNIDLYKELFIELEQVNLNNIDIRNSSYDINNYLDITIDYLNNYNKIPNLENNKILFDLKNNNSKEFNLVLNKNQNKINNLINENIYKNIYATLLTIIFMYQNNELVVKKLNNIRYNQNKNNITKIISKTYAYSENVCSVLENYIKSNIGLILMSIKFKNNEDNKIIDKFYNNYTNKLINYKI